MTSKNSLGKQIWHNMIRRSWCFALLVVGFFLVLPVYGAGRASNICGDTREVAKQLQNLQILFEKMLLTPTGNWLCTVLVMMAAVICGMSGFYYLDKKSQIDLYHSLPIKRGKLLMIRQISGFLLFFVPFVINVLLSLAVASAMKCFTMVAVLNACKFVLTETIYFFAVYEITILAMMLTGNALINTLMVLFLLFGGIWGKILFDALGNMFFSSYISHNAIDAIAPVTNFVNIFVEYCYEFDSSMVYDILLSGRIWKVLLSAIIIFGCLFPIYYKRPSEAAGKAIAFPQIEWLIKLAVSVLTTLTGAVMVWSIVNTDRGAWFLGAGVIIFVLTNIVMEMIFRADFKEGFKHIWHWGINLAVIGIIYCGFYFDWGRYDKYQPAENKVEAMAIYENAIPSSGYVDLSDDQIYLSDFHAIYQLVEKGIEGQTKASPFEEIEYYDEEERMEKDTILELLEKSKYGEVEAQQSTNPLYFEVGYKLKNGSYKFRKYVISDPDETVQELLANIYDQPDYKKYVYPILSKESSEIKNVTVETVMGYQMVGLNARECEEFVEALKTDLEGLTYEELRGEHCIGNIDIEVKENQRRYEYYDYPIFPSFINTIKFLEGKDIAFELDFSKIKIVSMTVETSSYYQMNGDEVEYPMVDYSNADLTKQQEIYMATNPDFYRNYMLDEDRLLDVMISFYDTETGMNNTYYSTFEKGKIPEFVLDDMIEKISNTESEE